MTKKIEGITKGLDKAMASMDLEKVSTIMEKFETQFEDIDVRTQVGHKDGFLFGSNTQSLYLKPLFSVVLFKAVLGF